MTNLVFDSAKSEIRSGTGGMKIKPGTDLLTIENGIVIPDGTLSEPSVRLGDDQDTGLYSRSNGSISLVADGTDMIRIDKPNNEIAIGLFTWPTTDGYAGAPLKTDGAGNLYFDAVEPTGGGTTLGSLSDVTITSPTTDQVLTWNGTEWVNQDVASGGPSYLLGSGTASVSTTATNHLILGDTDVTSPGDYAIYIGKGFGHHPENDVTDAILIGQNISGARYGTTGSVIIGDTVTTGSGSNGSVKKSVVIGQYAKHCSSLTNQTTESVTIGYGATGESYSVAIGNNTTNNGERSVSIGGNCYVSNTFAFAGGYDSDAYGDSSVSLGYKAYTNNYGSTGGAVAIGEGARATGDAISIGTHNDTSTETQANVQSIRMGYLADASGSTSIAVGTAAQASGQYSLALQRAANAATDYSIAIGFYATAPTNGMQIKVNNSSTMDMTSSGVVSSTGSFVMTNYTTAGRPAAGTAGRVVYDSDLGKLILDNGTSWVNLDGTAL